MYTTHSHTVLQDGRTPLMEASLGGHVDVVRVLIEAHADVRSQDKVWNQSNDCIMTVYSCDHSMHRMVGQHFILHHKRVMLMWSAYWLMLMCLSTIRPRYHNMSADCYVLPYIPLFLSVLHLVFPHYSLPHCSSHWHGLHFFLTYSPTVFLISLHVVVEDRDISASFVYLQDGRTALYQASKNGHLAAVQLLLQRHADVSLCDEVWIHCIG